MRVTNGGGRPAPDACRVCLKPRNGAMGGLWYGAEWTCTKCVDEDRAQPGRPIKAEIKGKR